MGLLNDGLSQFARKENAMCLFLAVCVHQCVRGKFTWRCTHTGIRVGHMMPHAQLAGSVVAFARLSGDLRVFEESAERVGGGLYATD
jgi:hypothetical protein